ncbi:MAG: TolC family protein [Solirubrobacterales bacterium]
MKAGISRVIAALVVMGLGTTVAAAQSPPSEQPAARQAAPATQAAQAPAPMKLTLDEAVRLALENNLDIAVDRIEPRVANARVSQASSAFLPGLSGVFGRTHNLAPPTSLLIGPRGVTTDALTSTLGVGQRLPWGGTSLTVSWVSTRQTTDSLFASFSPSLASTLQVGFSQPLLRDLVTDSPRTQLVLSKRNQEISDTRFRETVVRTLADVKRAYWDLVAARALVGVQQQALDLAVELVRTNTARVEVGQAPPLDLVSARAEQAQREDNLVSAQLAARQAEDRLRILILNPASSSFWNEAIEPADSPPIGGPAPDVEAVTRKAIESRQDLIRARDELANAQTSVKLYRSQKLPDLRLQASYGASGIGGRQYIRTGGFPGTITGTTSSSYGTVLNQVLARDFPAWTFGLTLSYPIGFSYEDAALASARLQESQARLRLQSAEIKAARQLRQSAWQMEANAKRIETSRAARQFAEQRLDAEQRRFEVGMSTSFLVVQAQRDLAQARNQELVAYLEYMRSTIDFEALQEAGPASGSTATVSGSSIVQFSAPTTSTTVTTSSSSSGRPGG